MNLSRFLTPPAAKPGKVFFLIWPLAHGIAWAVFLPRFLDLTGGSYLFIPTFTAPPVKIILAFSLIGLVEGLAETIVVIRYLPSWLFWLPACLVGALGGALFAQVFPEQFLAQLVVVFTCVTLLQWVALSLGSQNYEYWPLFRVIAAFAIFPVGLAALFGISFGASLLEDFELFSGFWKRLTVEDAAGYIGFVMGLVSSLITSFGMRLALTPRANDLPPSSPG